MKGLTDDVLKRIRLDLIVDELNQPLKQPENQKDHHVLYSKNNPPNIQPPPPPPRHFAGSPEKLTLQANLTTELRMPDMLR